MDYIFQIQIIGGHWIVAAFRMIMTGLEGERVGSEFGLYGVYVVLQVDWIMWRVWMFYFCCMSLF